MGYSWRKRIKHVVLSRLRRTQLTAAPFLATRPDIRPEIFRIHEIDYPSTEECAPALAESRKAYWKNLDPTWREDSDWETFGEACDRARVFLGIIKNLPDRTAIFGHGLFTTLCISVLRQPSSSDAELMRITHAAVYEQGQMLKNAEILPLVIADNTVLPPVFPAGNATAF